MGTQLPASSPVQTRSTEEEAVAVRHESLTKKCTVQLQKCASSPVIVQQLKEFMQQKERGLSFGEKSADSDANKSENDTEDPTCSGEVTETMMASFRQSVSNSSLVFQTKLNDAERDKEAAVLTVMLKEKCLTDKLIVEIKRLSQHKEILQLKTPTDVSDSAGDDQTKTDHQSESDTNHSNEDTSVIKVKNTGSTSSEDKIVSDKDEVVPQRRKKASQAPKEKKRRSTSADRPGMTRKACVSGLSVSRWKNKGNTSAHVFSSRTAQMGGNKAVDCSINELIPTQHRQPKQLLGGMNFSTPVRANRLNLSSLLADLTPNTNTWSRLKAALSVHRKGMVLLTPRSLHLSTSGSPRREELADVSQDLFATPFRTPLSKRLHSQLQSCSSLVLSEDADLSDAEKVYAECGQPCPLPWEECILPQRMKQCVKIGEGTFGEVFSTTNASGETVALKIIPLEGSEKVNGEEQKKFGEILHEIIISKELSSLKEKQHNQTHGFIGLNDLHCVQGCYPRDFMNAWDNFDRQKGSENDRPDFFEKDQLFIILEFEFGGSDLENSNGTLASLGVAKSILHQVTAALAVAEQELHFEHRDLHWGNVLVKTTKQKMGSFLLNGAVHSLETRGVLVRIIDYSLSRLEIDDLTVSCDISNDEELFMGQGDYQFDIYRLMRQENGNGWSDYHPHTNVLWLHYLCSKLLSMKYRGSGGKRAKDTREELNRFYDNVLQYGSATEALQNYPMFQ
uniref:serine/threonine-protein kinase haspin n=1 Tax=Semicossyphus pulcher TaxID=241346 RepID=UPI0037E88EBE